MHKFWHVAHGKFTRFWPREESQTQASTIIHVFVYIYLRCTREQRKLYLSVKTSTFTLINQTGGKNSITISFYLVTTQQGIIYDITVVYECEKCQQVYGAEGVNVAYVWTQNIHQQKYSRNICQHMVQHATSCLTMGVKYSLTVFFQSPQHLRYWNKQLVPFSQNSTQTPT